jgi:tRNA (guanine9-N1)-methyltransferase
MNTKGLKSLTSQLAYCYSLNKKVDNPFAFHFCSYSGELRKYLEHMGSKNWLIYTHEPSLPDIEEFATQFEDKMVYLSPDSDNVLDTINKNTLYIIGGLVDKPVSRNQSLSRAKVYNIPHARLPLEDYISDINNTVLNVNTVIEIISGYIKHNDWYKAISEVIPKRMLK